MASFMPQLTAFHPRARLPSFLWILARARLSTDRTARTRSTFGFRVGGAKGHGAWTFRCSGKTKSLVSMRATRTSVPGQIKLLCGYDGCALGAAVRAVMA